MGGGPISSSGVTQYKYESFDMMQRKTEPLRAQPTLEILLALPLIVGPSLLNVSPLCPTWWICSAFFPHGRLAAPPSEAPLGKDLSSPG